jgi:hypothetical protein
MYTTWQSPYRVHKPRSALLLERLRLLTLFSLESVIARSAATKQSPSGIVGDCFAPGGAQVLFAIDAAPIGIPLRQILVMAWSQPAIVTFSSAEMSDIPKWNPVRACMFDNEAERSSR